MRPAPKAMAIPVGGKAAKQIGGGRSFGDLRKMRWPPVKAAGPSPGQPIPLCNRPTTSEALWPPKPKLLDIATETFRSRAWLGV